MTRGNPLKTHKKCKTRTNSRAQNTRIKRSQPWWHPRPARAVQPNAPSGEVRLARRMNVPSGEVRLARGLNAPSGEVRLARGLLRARHPRSCSRARAFNALTPQDCATTLTRLGITPRRCSTDSLGRPSPPLRNTVRRGRCQPRDTMPPTSVRLAPNPRRWAGGTIECFSHDYTGLHRDVRPAGAVFSVAVSPVRPSPQLQRHAGYCDDIPGVVGEHGDRTSPCPPLCLVRTPVDGTLELARGRRPGNRPLHHHHPPARAQDAP
jgi:hypothetical protein